MGASHEQPGAAGHVPPLRLPSLTGLYDVVARATLRESAWRPLLVEQAALARGQRVAELGCGTASLTVLLARSAPGARVVGLDADGPALEIARGKLRGAGLDVELRQERIEDADLQPASLDRVVASLVLHHLLPEARHAALVRALGWLRPGGEIHLADWGRAGSVLMRLAFLPVQLLDGFARTSEHVRAGMEPCLRRAGFVDVAETHRVRTALGVISLYRGASP